MKLFKMKLFEAASYKKGSGQKFLDMDDKQYALKTKLEVEWNDPKWELIPLSKRKDMEKEVKSLLKQMNTLKLKISEEEFENTIQTIYSDVSYENFQENEWY